MSCLDRGRTTNLGYRKFTAKNHSNPSLIHNSNFDPDDVRAGLWLPTQYFTLTDSLIFYDMFMSSMSLQEKKSGNGFLKPTNMSHKFPFGSASHLENIDSWKAGSPASNPLWLKVQSRQWFIGLQQSHVTTESAINIQILDTITVYCTQQILGMTTPWPNPLLLCMRLVFYLQLQQRDGHDASRMQTGGAYCGSHGPQASGREWTLRFPKRHGFLKQVSKTNLFSAVRHS